MVLYALSVLPLLSICDKSTSDELFTELVTGTATTVTLNADTFAIHMSKLQAKYNCLGISCEMSEYLIFGKLFFSCNHFWR
jgi:hypothetical protein